MYKKLTEFGLIIVFIGFFMYMGPANILSGSFQHPFPWNYNANDAYMAYTYSEHIYKSGNFRHYPQSISLGYDNCVACNPPFIYIWPAILAHATGLQVYDTHLLFLYLTTVLSCLVAYLIIRRFSRNVAMLSLPVMLLLFYKNNIIGFTWGIWTAIEASMTLLLFIWVFGKQDLKHSWILLFIAFTGTMLGNIAYMIFAFMFMFAYFVAYFIMYKGINKGLVKRTLYVVVGSVLANLYYLWVFKNARWDREIGGYGFKLFQPRDWQWAPHFGEYPIWILVLIGLGILYCLYHLYKTWGDRDKRHQFFSIVSFGVLYLITLGIYYGLDSRAVKARFHLPIYISFFFAVSIYLAIQLINKRKEYNIYIAAALSLILIIGMTYSYRTELGNPGMMNEYVWASYNWIENNTPEDSTFFLFYADQFSQSGFALAMERQTVRVEAQEYFNNFNLSMSVISSYQMAEYACSFSYLDGREIKQYPSIDGIGIRDYCDYNYLYFLIEPKASVNPVLVEQNKLVRDKLLAAGSRELYNNGVVSILEGDCDV